MKTEQQIIGNREATTTCGRLSSANCLRAGMALVAVVLLCWFVWGARPPQMGADAAVFATVDALFTAVNARDAKLLERCQQRLQALKGAGKLPAAASDYLEAIIREARAERWQSAAERLFDFMKVQRRDGARSQGSGFYSDL